MEIEFPPPTPALISALMAAYALGIVFCAMGGWYVNDYQTVGRIYLGFGLFLTFGAFAMMWTPILLGQ